VSRDQFNRAILLVHYATQVTQVTETSKEALESLDNRRDRIFDSHPQKPNRAEQQ